MKNYLDYISEEINITIPPEVKTELNSKEVRMEMKKKYGKSAFLDNENLKFPVINPLNDEVDCRLIYAAYVRSKIFENKGGTSVNPKSYYANINKKAKDLYKTQNCYNKINTNIAENTLDILYFTENFITEKEIVESTNLFFNFLE